MKVDIDNVTALRVTRAYLQEHVIMMKQYKPNSTLKNYIGTIEDLSTLYEFENFVVKFDKAIPSEVTVNSLQNLA
jgi:hypothetical protein